MLNLHLKLYFMDIDRLFSIHQSHSLMQIKAINKQLLIAQYAQCEQISTLQKEIKTSNCIAKQILKRQLEEAQHREQQKYYKALAFSMKEAVEHVKTEKDVNFKCFLYELYSKTILENLQEAQNNLEEISDKEYCNKIICSLQKIQQEYLAANNIYSQSLFAKLLIAQISYIKQQNLFKEKNCNYFICKTKIQEEIKTLQEKANKQIHRGCLKKTLIFLSICGLFLMILSIFTDITVLPNLFIIFFLPFFIPLLILIRKERKWKMEKDLLLHKTEQKIEMLIRKINKLDEDIYNDKKLLSESPYIQIKNSISSEYPHWEKTLQKIDVQIPKLKDLNSKKNQELFVVAQYAIAFSRADSALIQRKFSCSSQKAKSYIEELENIGILKNGIVQIHSKETLTEYWNML